MSLMPRSRLSNDSDRSPTVAVSTMARPSATPAHQGPSRASVTPATPSTTANTADPARPSQDFFGLTDGASGCLPHTTPNAYPPMSLPMATMRNASTR